MNKLILSLILFFAISIASFASTKDSVSYTAGYANDVYYSMSTGVVKTIPRATWDIAFGTSNMSSSIIINDGSGVELYTYPTSDTSGWNSFDTTGYSSWTAMYNSEISWEEGAFSQNASGHPDYGWANYNSVTHNLVGDSLFLIKTINGDFKKLWIISKQSAANIYTYRFADVDGSNDTTVVFDVNAYTSKNFVYYSLDTRQILDRDPDTDSWDILFTKYVGAQPQGGFYPVTGVLSNNNVEVATATLIDTSLVNWSDYTMTDNKANIGWDWKSFNMSTFTYEVADSQAYFVQDIFGDVYKLIFTGFVGSSNGNVFFTKSLLSNVGMNNITKTNEFAVYPNPAENYIQLDFTGNTLSNASVTLYDLSGKMVFTKAIHDSSERLNLSEFNSGFYLLQIQNNAQIYTQSLIIK